MTTCFFFSDLYDLYDLFLSVENWKTSHKLKTLGMPKYIASGSHQKGIRYRFMVMERFGTDLQKLFEANGKKFPTKTVYQMAIRLVSSNQTGFSDPVF